jgi:zinc ribbon protein
VIVCRQCGHQNADNETFCASCGRFLEWTGERVVVAEPEPEPPPAAEPEPEPARHGFIDRVKQAVGLDEAASQATTIPEPAPRQVSISSASPNPNAPAPAPYLPPSIAGPQTPYVKPPAPSAPPPSYPPLPATVTPAASAPNVPPARPTVPVGTTPYAPPAQPPRGPAPYAPTPHPTAYSPPPTSPPTATSPPPAPPVEPISVYPEEPMSRRPVSVAPTAPRPRPVRTAEPPTRRQPGDLICGQCGEGNDPSRHFCRRCGNPLEEAVVVRLPWYRRFLNRIFGTRTREAGWRPQRIGRPNVIGGAWRIIRLAIAAAIVVAVLAFLLIPSFHTLVVDRVTSAVTAVRKIVHPNYDPIYPIGASASSSIAGHPPSLAMDKFNNTYWAASTSDHNPTLVLRFQGPEDLAEIGFTSGASGTAPADQFLSQPRPHAVHLVFSDGTTQDLNLVDEASAQFYPTNVKQVTFVEIHVLSTWATANASPSSVAITEVEFRIKD